MKWRRLWTVAKLVFLYLQYWLVGLDEAAFQLAKGGYLVDLEWYSAAAKAFQRALRETNSSYAHGALGYCYVALDLPDKAVPHLRTAYSRHPLPDYGINLAQALIESGDRQSGAELLESLRPAAAGNPDFEAALQKGARALAALQTATDSARPACEGAAQQAVGAHERRHG